MSRIPCCYEICCIRFFVHKVSQEFKKAASTYCYLTDNNPHLAIYASRLTTLIHHRFLYWVEKHKRKDAAEWGCPETRYDQSTGDCSRTSEIEAIYVHSPPYSFKINYQQCFQSNFLWNFLRPIALYGIVDNERRCTSGDHCRLGRIYWINTALFSKPISNLESLKVSSGGRITARMFWIQIYLNKLSISVYNCILVTLCGFNVCNVG